MKETTQSTDFTPEAATSFADFHAGYVATYIQLADAKAGATFTVTASVIAYLLTWDEFIRAVTAPAATVTFLLVIVTLGSLIVSAGLSFAVIAPRLSKSGGDLVFWQSVAGQDSGKAYATKVLSQSAKEMARQRLGHCYDLSRVCARKYTALRWAMLVGAVAMCTSLTTRLTLPATTDKLTGSLTSAEKTDQNTLPKPDKSLK